MLLHLFQPIESRLKELGKARPNGKVMYLGANEVSKFFFSLFLSHTHIHIDTGRALKTFEAAGVK